MALSSMTGYGHGSAAAGGVRVDVELSSVNRKQLDVRVNLPRPLAALESRVLEQVQAAMSRGHVSGAVTVHETALKRQQGVRVDTALAGAYVRVLRRTAETLKLADDLTARDLLALPDVVTRASMDEDLERIGTLLTRAVRQALQRLNAMRVKEGESLAADLRRRLTDLAACLELIRAAAPQVTAKYRALLEGRLRQAGFTAVADDPQVLKELALFADRADIAEEVTRLDSHLGQAVGLLKSAEPVGRTLDFLAQEMYREINTIGSKANDVGIVREVIRFKTDLERIREQVQNVE